MDICLDYFFIISVVKLCRREEKKNSSDGNRTQCIRRRRYLSTQGNDRTSRAIRSQSTQIFFSILRFIIEIFINR